MEQNNTVGIIGQKYEDRKTGKTGTLVGRDEENRKLTLSGVGDTEFTISYSAFRSSWRKSSDTVAEIKEVVDDFPTITVANNESTMTAESLTVSEFEAKAFDARHGYVSDDGITLEVYVAESDADLLVLQAVRTSTDDGHNYLEVSMMPDIYTFTNFGSHIETVTFDLSTNLSVHGFVTLDVEEFLGVVLDAVHDINLYGYVVSEEE